ncbi:MAG: carboxypeptidase-like regulatory domain-containing protein [Bacteroidota bacterium]|nr:carboxypeptidase-like regulatory domain-containing protein [Bacteroidota bacterium]
MVFVALPTLAGAQEAIRGIIYEKDSSNVMPYVYVINKTTGSGAMSNLEGKFYITAKMQDTIICSYVGFAKEYIPVKNLKKNSKGEYAIVMRTQYINLNTVTVTSFKYKTYEREYMNKIIDMSHIRTIDAFQSPFTAAYMQFSRRGREIRKLAKIFDDLLIEEEVAKKINPEIIRSVTGDDKLDVEAFRKFCLELSNQYILTHDGYDLYNKVMDCYKRYKSEGR